MHLHGPTLAWRRLVARAQALRAEASGASEASEAASRHMRAQWRQVDVALTARRLLLSAVIMLKTCMTTYAASLPLLEVEARLGRREGGFRARRFVPGIAADQFDRLLTSMRARDGWSRAPEAFEQRDSLFMHDGNPVRTSVTCRPHETLVSLSPRASSLSSTITTSVPRSKAKATTGGLPAMMAEYSPHLSIQHVVKRKLLAADTVLPDGVVLRLAVAIEQPLPSDKLPAVVQPRYVRIKHRHAFVHRDMWEYALTRVWSGPSFVEAEDAMSSQPRLEAEVECLNLKATLDSYGGRVRVLAASLACKAVDMQQSGTGALVRKELQHICQRACAAVGAHAAGEAETKTAASAAGGASRSAGASGASSVSKTAGKEEETKAPRRARAAAARASAGTGVARSDGATAASGQAGKRRPRRQTLETLLTVPLIVKVSPAVSTRTRSRGTKRGR